MPVPPGEEELHGDSDGVRAINAESSLLRDDSRAEAQVTGVVMKFNAIRPDRLAKTFSPSHVKPAQDEKLRTRGKKSQKSTSLGDPEEGR